MTKRRGFAAMSPKLRRELSARGGRAVQETGDGHRWTKAEARAAGRLGGIAKAKTGRKP